MNREEGLTDLKMKTCWNVLGIEKTGDLPAIQRARRSLIKQWHPDVVPSAEEKQARTSRCAEINSAFDEAVRAAKMFNPVATSQKSPAEPLANGSDQPVFHITLGGIPRNQCLIAMALVLLFTFQSFIYLFVAIAALTVLVGSIAVVGIVDILFVTIVVKPALSLVSLLGSTIRKHEKTIIWLSLLILNVAVVRQWPASAGLALFGTMVGWVLRAGSAFGIPAGLLFVWRKDSECQPMTPTING
jgi:hypothetical protein